jgi:heme exporter protein C
VLALVGAVNVPIIHFSVEWWSSLHQGPTLIRAGGPAIEPAMLWPLLAMILGFSLLFGALLLSRVRTEVLFRERRARWVRKLVYPEETA